MRIPDPGRIFTIQDYLAFEEESESKDEFLDGKLLPITQTNRGCPFTCTFCVDGIKDRSRVYYKEVSRFEKELEYIATHYEGKVLTLADLNFGMYNQDIDLLKFEIFIDFRAFIFNQNLKTICAKNDYFFICSVTVLFL